LTSINVVVKKVRRAGVVRLRRRQTEHFSAQQAAAAALGVDWKILGTSSCRVPACVTIDVQAC
jgi:hypothetical protein